MRLPDNSVGPTDVQAYRDCPRRFAFGMRRHAEVGEHPEAQGPSTAYGSAIHEAIAYAEQHDAGDREAMQHAVDMYGRWLDPDDFGRMADDLATYRERDYLGVRLVGVELEVKIPLFELDGQTIYLRGRLDRLYQRLDNPAVFIHVDYKSSKWPKSESEVHNDRQLWAYNLLIHEVWPECETLVQVYDQLAHGPITTRKSREQREQIRAWLIAQITTIVHDEQYAPTKNQWCPWCPILESCPVVRELTDFATGTIAALAPAEKQGRKTVLNLDPAIFEVYAEQLDDVALAMKVLSRFDDSVKAVLRDLPPERRSFYGYELRDRTATAWSPEALRAAHEAIGDELFYEAVGLTKTAVEKLPAEDRDVVLGMAEYRKGAPVLRKRG